MIRRAQAAPPTWSTPGQALRLMFERQTLRNTLPIAALVGTVLSLINQATVIDAGEATWATWVRVAANYAVPFCVSSAGYLGACRATPDRHRDQAE